MGPVPQRQDRFSSRWHKGLTGVGALFCVAAALMVPFAYPTQTLWYKTGMDKILLIAGQLIGLLAMVLLGGQIVLALRPIFLERLFGAALLMRWHRGNGVLATGLAFGHALLVLIPEGLATLPIGWTFWPEMTGAAVLLLLLGTTVISRFRAALRFEYRRWRLFHRPLGYLIVALVPLHVLFVSESFAGGPPRVGLLIGVLLLFAMAFVTWFHRGRSNQH